ncbi:hypothetical protein PSEUBRA_003458 [Kalmanozyma brasiliensis GHG001]|uniref:Uncharacterized protein n=1 Tax=Kalmanozyma brasiliensis (strain GHG001) TaxID=1365824 RepID=V5EXN6_KALBG|nr:uncharacterized protein PSEUBRA_003458 [Kalmanozyma brasiliensis GHG001]EST07279.1 hypothetical protein PSEUBRA_003458 [Kalmanozyma brasiliensis GHG001]
MGVLSESLAREDWRFIEGLDDRHPDRAISYELAAEGLLVRMWSIDNVNTDTYGPFAIDPQQRTRVEDYINRLNNTPCPLGEGCPSKGIPQESLSAQDWDALNRAVHRNAETTYAVTADGLVVIEHNSEEDGVDVTHGPFAVQPQYQQQVEDYVRARNA